MTEAEAIAVLEGINADLIADGAAEITWDVDYAFSDQVADGDVISVDPPLFVDGVQQIFPPGQHFNLLVCEVDIGGGIVGFPAVMQFNGMYQH